MYQAYGKSLIFTKAVLLVNRSKTKTVIVGNIKVEKSELELQDPVRDATLLYQHFIFA